MSKPKRSSQKAGKRAKGSGRGARPARAKSAAGVAQPSRWNFELRTHIDEIVQLARELFRSGSRMTQEELEEKRDRIAWLADEIWRSAVYGPIEGKPKPPP